MRTASPKNTYGFSPIFRQIIPCKVASGLLYLIGMYVIGKVCRHAGTTIPSGRHRSVSTTHMTV